MSFYQAIQLSASSLKPLIKETEDERIKRKYKLALIVKSILCLTFCIAVVLLFAALFGNENSIVGVVTVIGILTYRVSNLDFKVKESALAIFGIFLIFAISPYLATKFNPLVGFIINFISIMAIIVISCHNVLLSNQSIFLLSYLLLYGYELSSFGGYINRVIGLMVGGAIISLIFYFKQRNRNFENSFKDILKDFDFNNSRTKWQIKLVLAVTLAVFLGELLNLPKVMWIGISCMSILQPNEAKVAERIKARPMYVIVGCGIFATIYLLVPEVIKGNVGMVGGLLVGFSATYNWQTSFNCFGALASSVPVFGLEWAIVIRIVSNLVGAIYSKYFSKIFDKIEEKLSTENKTVPEIG